MKKLNKDKVINITKKAINTILTIMVILFLLVVCLQRFSGNKISLFNYRLFTVVSGSMEPKYKIGDVLISKEVKPEKIKTGDTISYLGNKGDFDGKVITHQVTSIKKDATGKYIFNTKGIANPIGDIYPVYENQIYGVVIYKLKILSLIYKVVGTTLGLFIFVIIPLLYIIGSEVIGLMLEKEEQRRSKLK